MNDIREEFVRKISQQLTDRQITKKYIPKYLKPKMIVDEMGQYPYRCPICWLKHIYKGQAQECIDRCWERLPPLVWEHIMNEAEKPKEVGSWQWDLDERHDRYCGVVKYDNGEIKYFIGDVRVTFITEDELIELLKGGGYIFQRSKFELPERLKPFENYPKANREDPNRFELLHKITGVKD